MDSMDFKKSPPTSCFIKSNLFLEITKVNNTVIESISFNKYNIWHWGKKKIFKDKLKEQLITQTNNKLHLGGGYNLDFKFYFNGRNIDNVNIFHYCKIIEDTLFKEDKDNGWIKVETFKSEEEYNYVFIVLTEITK